MRGDHRRRAACGLAAALLLLLPVSFAADGGAPQGYLSETLPNGLRVSILPDPANPVVATQIWYHVGSANEEPKTRGFAHLFEHLMFGGTAEQPKQAYWSLHERNGGDNNAFTSFDETVYVSEMPPGEHEKVLDLEADRMVHLALNQENLDNEKRIVTEELRLGTENDPFGRLGVKALKAVLGDHPYALTPIGTKEDIAAATLDHAREFYSRYYRPRNAHVIVVGPVDGPATLEAVKRTFGRLSSEGETPPDVPPIYGRSFPERVDLEDDIPPVEVALMGFPTPPADSPDEPALEILRDLLANGRVNPFEEELVRRRGKALAAGTEILELRRGGAIVFYSAALPYRREATAFRLMDETRQRLADGAWLSEETLAASRRRLVRSDLARVYRAASRAGAIGTALWWQGDERLAFGRADRLASVTLAEVRAAYGKYVALARPIRVYIRPERVPLLVRLFGWLYPVVSR